MAFRIRILICTETAFICHYSQIFMNKIFQSQATCRKNSNEFKAVLKNIHRVDRGKTGSLECDDGYTMKDCLFYTPWWYHPAGVEPDGTVPSCSVTCTTEYCFLSVICTMPLTGKLKRNYFGISYSDRIYIY